MKLFQCCCIFRMSRKIDLYKSFEFLKWMIWIKLIQEKKKRTSDIQSKFIWLQRNKWNIDQSTTVFSSCRLHEELTNSTGTYMKMYVFCKHLSTQLQPKIYLSILTMSFKGWYSDSILYKYNTLFNCFIRFFMKNALFLVFLFCSLLQKNVLILIPLIFYWKND